MTNEEIEETFSRTRDYLSQRFTRDEKIKLMTESISQALKYEFGRKIRLCSLDLHYNFSVEHQKKALEYLANDKKCIKFHVSDEAVPKEFVDIAKLEMPIYAEDDFAPHWDLDSSKIDEKAESARYFIVDALPNFEKVANDICGTSNDYHAMTFNNGTGNLFVDGVFAWSYKVGTVPYSLFKYLFSSDYIVGDEFSREDFTRCTGKATQRSFSQIKSDLKLSPDIADVFLRIKNGNLRFYPRVEVSTLSNDENASFAKALKAISDTNRVVPF